MYDDATCVNKTHQMAFEEEKISAVNKSLVISVKSGNLSLKIGLTSVISIV